MEIQLAIGYLTHGSNGDSMLIYWEPEKTWEMILNQETMVISCGF